MQKSIYPDIYIYNYPLYISALVTSDLNGLTLVLPFLKDLFIGQAMFSNVF